MILYTNSDADGPYPMAFSLLNFFFLLCVDVQAMPPEEFYGKNLEWGPAPNRYTTLY